MFVLSHSDSIAVNMKLSANNILLNIISLIWCIYF